MRADAGNSAVFQCQNEIGAAEVFGSLRNDNNRLRLTAFLHPRADGSARFGIQRTESVIEQQHGSRF